MRVSVALSAVFLAVACYFSLAPAPAARPPAGVPLPGPEVPPAEAAPDDVHRFCSTCHAYPAPESFTREHWPKEVRRAYDFFRDSNHRLNAPDIDRVIEYFVRRAPNEYPAQLKCAAAGEPLPFRFERSDWSPTNGPATAKVTNVHLAHLFSATRLDVLVCHNNPGGVWAVRPYETPPRWELLAEVLGPCHVDVVDLDGDGIKDLLVADLGSLPPTEHLTGRVVWLRGDRAGRFSPVVLLEGVGRVTDVRACDFNGDGKPDLVVAVFGWQKGEILYLENRTTDSAKPTFRATALDTRSGCMAVEIGDINADGHPDVVALFGQEHETVVAFLGDGRGGFTKKTVYAAPHPAYGSSGIQLVDLDNDGDLDVLYTNGDTLDPPFLLKPYHGVQWLENRSTFPFVQHSITAQFGAMRAVAADFGGGAKPIVSVSFLPPSLHSDPRATSAEAVQLLKPVGPGRFERHVLTTGAGTHFSCAAGDIFGDGRTHLVVGNYHMVPGQDRNTLLTVWKNLGSAK